MAFNFSWDSFQANFSNKLSNILDELNGARRPEPIVSNIRISDLKINKDYLQLGLVNLLDINDDHFTGKFHLNYDTKDGGSNYITFQFNIELNRFCLSNSLSHRLKRSIDLSGNSSFFDIAKDIGYDFAEPNFVLAGKSSIIPIQLNLVNFKIISDLIIDHKFSQENGVRMSFLGDPVVDFEFFHDDNFELLESNYTEVIEFFKDEMVPLFIGNLQELITTDEMSKLIAQLEPSNGPIVENISQKKPEEQEEPTNEVKIRDEEVSHIIDLESKDPDTSDKSLDRSDESGIPASSPSRINLDKNPFDSDDEVHNTTDSSCISQTPSSNSSNSVIEDLTVDMNAITIDEDDEVKEIIQKDSPVETPVLIKPKKSPKRRTISFKELRTKFSPLKEPLKISDDDVLDFGENDAIMNFQQLNSTPVKNPVYDDRLYNMSKLESTPSLKAGSYLSNFFIDADEEFEMAFMGSPGAIPEYIKENKKFKFIKIGKVQKFVHMFEGQTPSTSPSRSGVPSRAASRNTSRVSSSEMSSPTRSN